MRIQKGKKKVSALILSGALAAAAGLLVASPASAYYSSRYWSGAAYANQVKVSPSATTYGGAVYTAIATTGSRQYVGVYYSSNDLAGSAYGGTNQWTNISVTPGIPWSTVQCWWNSSNNAGAPQMYCNQSRD